MSNKQHNFATSPAVSVGWTYAGELALPYIHASVLSAPTLHGGNVRLLDGVRYKAIIPVIANGVLIEPASCDFKTTATTTLAQSVLTVTSQMVNLQLCKNSFNDSDTAGLTGQAWWQGDAYSNEQGVPDDFADALMLYVAKQVQADIENNIWMGNATASGFTAFDGFKKASGNTAGATAFTGTADLKTTAGVLLALEQMLLKMPLGLVGNFEDVSFYVNPQSIAVYNMAIGQTGNGYDSAVALAPNTRFLGYKLVSAPGIVVGEGCVASKNNLFVGIGTADSDSSAQVLDMTPLDGSNNWRLSMRFAVGTQIGVAGECVWFKD